MFSDKVLGHHALNIIEATISTSASGRALLLINSKNISKYLYADILKDKTPKGARKHTISPSLQGNTSPTNQLASFSIMWIKGPTNTCNNIETCHARVQGCGIHLSAPNQRAVAKVVLRGWPSPWFG